MIRRVLVAAGSSGGHIFPALSFIDALKKEAPGVEILLVLPKENILAGKNDFGCKIKLLPVFALKLKPALSNIRNFFRFLYSCFRALFIVIDFNPDLAVGFGSIVSVPLVMSCWFLRIKTLIHEQNVTPGVANRFLARFSDKVLVSFEETKKYLHGSGIKVVVTGNPIRKDLTPINKKEALHILGLTEEKFTILVMGGSQGSHNINKGFAEFVLLFPEKSILQVIHLCGRSDFDFLDKVYKGAGINYKLFDFFDKMQYAYSASDLVLSRAGAATLSEIAFFRLPAVLVPYPFARCHQLENARVLEAKGASFVINDKDLSGTMLNDVLRPLIKDPEKLNLMRSAYEGIFRQDAAKRIAEEAVK